MVNLNTFLNNNKTPNIPSLNVNGTIISNFDKKAGLFSLRFASQCAPINYSSVLPPLDYWAKNEHLASANNNEGEIDLILKNLNPEKAHIWFNISVRMI